MERIRLQHKRSKVLFEQDVSLGGLDGLARFFFLGKNILILGRFFSGQFLVNPGQKTENWLFLGIFYYRPVLVFLSQCTWPQIPCTWSFKT